MTRNSGHRKLLAWPVHTLSQCALFPCFRKCQENLTCSHFSKPKPSMPAQLLPCESTCTVEEKKNTVMGMHTTTCSTNACPDPHSSAKKLLAMEQTFPSPCKSRVFSFVHIVKLQLFILLAYLQEIIFAVIRCFRFILTFNQLQTQLIASCLQVPWTSSFK